MNTVLPRTGTVTRLRRKLAHLRVRGRDWWRGETAATFFDLGNPAELGQVLAAHAADDIPTAAPLAWKAALAYQARPDIRAALPLGLTPRDRGLLLAWLLEHGTREVGFGAADALAAVRAGDRDPSRGLAETYLLQPAWQRAVPHGLTPFGWDDLKGWLRQESGLAGRWFDRAKLVRRFGAWDELRLLLRANPRLAATFPAPSGHTDPSPILRWVRQLPSGVPCPGRRWRAELRDDLRAGVHCQPAVTLLGLFRYTSGLQEAATGMAAALEAAGVRVDRRDVPGPAVRDNPTAHPLDRLELADVSIIHTGLDTSVRDAYDRAGLAPHPGTYRVATWWWELEDVPAEWAGRAAEVHEIWAPTRFIADALRPLGKPVHHMPLGLALPPFAPLGKAAFGMDPGKWTFAALFDVNSRLGRKNPLAAVRAFREAFTAADPVELVVKMTPPGPTPGAEVRELSAACGAAGVRLIAAHFSRAETLAFLAAADALVSLHRSEGFGLPLAEAMLLGKPVITTGYSGNLDFMTPDNSYLVGYDRVPIAADDPPYRRGFVWAEPRVGHAAELLRQVAGRPAEARAVGRRAREELTRTLDVAAAGRRMRDRLAAIRTTRGHPDV